jgi:hypothetical protein
MYYFVGALLQTEVRVGHFHSEKEPHERLGEKKENCVLENSSKYNRGRIGDIISVQITEGRTDLRLVVVIVLQTYRMV